MNGLIYNMKNYIYNYIVRITKIKIMHELIYNMKNYILLEKQKNIYIYYILYYINNPLKVFKDI